MTAWSGSPLERQVDRAIGIANRVLQDEGIFFFFDNKFSSTDPPINSRFDRRLPNCVIPSCLPGPANGISSAPIGRTAILFREGGVEDPVWQLRAGERSVSSQLQVCDPSIGPLTKPCTCYLAFAYWLGGGGASRTGN